jgi:methyltransferase
MMLALLVVALLPMIVEARLAARHERALRAAGAVEPPGDVYGVMRIAYPACFLAMSIEGWLRGLDRDLVLAIGAGVFAVSKALKYWAIATLGERWTFRVLVPPDSRRVVAGPYTMMRHPNYVGVLGELLGMGLMAHAPVTGAASVIGFGALMAARIRVEERALGVRP